MTKSFVCSFMLILLGSIPLSASATLLTYEFTGDNPSGSAILTYEELVLDGDADHRNLKSITGDFADAMITYIFDSLDALSGFNYDVADLSFQQFYCCGGGATSTNSPIPGALLTMGTGSPTSFNITVTDRSYNFTAVFGQPNINSVPEPSTLAVFALGMIGLASRRFKKQS
jgi:hypothetical protein